MYAHLEAAIPTSCKEIADKVLHHLQCAHRFTTQGNKWALEKSSCLTVIDLSLELAEGMYLWVIKTVYNEQGIKICLLCMILGEFFS